MSIFLQSYKSDTQYIEFTPPEMRGEGPHVSIVIGPNGSGKSRTMASLVSEFDLIDGMINSDEPKRRKSAASETAELRLVIDGRAVRFERKSTKLSCFLDDVEVSPSKCPFPRRIIAVAHLPVDRFRFSKNEDDLGAYRYLGLRQATNLTTTGALETRLVSALVAGQAKVGFHEQVAEWLQLLSLDADISVIFDEVPARLLAATHQSEFARVAEETYATRRGNPAMSASYFYTRFEKDLDMAWQCFQVLKYTAFLEKAGSGRHRLLLQLHEKKIPHELSLLLESARRLRLLPSMTIEFRRLGSALSFSDLSSGEQQILGTMIRLLAELEDYSIVVIDEPEVSLHPSWQMNYVPTLQRMLRRRRSAHVILATHSHFLVSDAHPNQATVVAPEIGGAGGSLFLMALLMVVHQRTFSIECSELGLPATCT